jgi:hypothetical protein
MAALLLLFAAYMGGGCFQLTAPEEQEYRCYQVWGADSTWVRCYPDSFESPKVAREAR